jgi:hypothetical protein
LTTILKRMMAMSERYFVTAGEAIIAGRVT